MYVAPESKVLFALANVAATSVETSTTEAQGSDDLPLDEWE